MKKGQGRRGGNVSKKPQQTRKPTPAMKAPIVQTAKSRCVKCQSTEREPYYGIVVRNIPGRDENGQEYTHIVWSRTKCKNCGQHRVDRYVENRIEADAERE